MRPWHVRSGAVAIVLLAGCEGSGYDPPNYVGNDFKYGCVGFADVVCDQAFPAPEAIPDGASSAPPIALGGQFAIANGASLSPTRILDVRPEVFEAKEEGVAAILFGHTALHVEVRKPTDIRITHEITAVSNEFSQIVGVDQFDLRIPDRFRASPVDSEGHMLAGDIGCTWTSTNTSVVTIESDPANNIVTFRIVGPGDGAIHVEMGDLAKDVPFSIQ